MTRPRAVLFAFEGVISNIENVHIAAWEQTLGMMGLSLPTDRCVRAVIEGDQDFLHSVFTERAIQESDLAGWVSRKRELAAAMLANEPRFYPGVVPLLHHLRARLTLAFHARSDLIEVDAALRQTGIHADLQIVTSGDRPTQLHQKALKELGLRPSETVGMEAGPDGLLAARAAGLRTIAVGHTLDQGEWTGASLYLPDLKNLEAVDTALGLDS